MNEFKSAVEAHLIDMVSVSYSQVYLTFIMLLIALLIALEGQQQTLGKLATIY